MTASKTSEGPEEANFNAWALLSSVLKQDSNKDTVTIKSFYESQQFDMSDFNKRLGVDGEELKLKSKISWVELDLEQKMFIGLLCYKKGLVFKD